MLCHCGSPTFRVTAKYDPTVILDKLHLSAEELHQQTGWELKPEGACKANRCVPVSGLATKGDMVDVTDFARRMGMPLAHDEHHRIWSLGPESGGRVLRTAEFPDLVLADFDANAADFADFRGQKVLLIAWASY